MTRLRTALTIVCALTLLMWFYLDGWFHAAAGLALVGSGLVIGMATMPRVAEALRATGSWMDGYRAGLADGADRPDPPDDPSCG